MLEGWDMISLCCFSDDNKLGPFPVYDFVMELLFDPGNPYKCWRSFK